MSLRSLKFIAPDTRPSSIFYLGHSRPLFLYFVISTQLFTGGSYKTADLWRQKQPPYQLRNINCPLTAIFDASFC